jgi:hypothetical protein
VAVRLEAVFYRAADGSEPVDSFIAALPVEEQVALDNQIARSELLSVRQPHLHGSFSRSSSMPGTATRAPTSPSFDRHDLARGRGRSVERHGS